MKIRSIILTLLIPLLVLHACSRNDRSGLHELFTDPPASARPWVFWYWIKAAVSKEGITADLEAMKKNGIAGAYLIPVQGPEDPPLYEPVAEQLSPAWWELVEFALSEANRLNLQIAMHSCDGFAVAGGPWITEEMSMQKVVWSELGITGKAHFSDTLPQPEMYGSYYRDIAVFAFPTPVDAQFTTASIKPGITTNMGSEDPGYLVDPENKRVFRSDDPGWIQYEFEEAFPCRTIHIRTGGLNYASHHLAVETSNDGIHFDSLCRLEPPRHGWQDYEAGITHSIPYVKARYFRFVYSHEGVEQGSEDLDAARWNPALKLVGLELSGRPVIHQFEGKNGSIWRISQNSDKDLLPDSVCIPISSIRDITSHMDSSGYLDWDVPDGKWTILRIGHTSTGHINYMGGGGLGLECDKFDPEIAEFQFDQWFGKVFDKTGPDLSREVLKVFHIDSWECGSQNWSGVFEEEFLDRRKYSLKKYLPVMTGLPVESAEISEQFLYDVRMTIDELVTGNFFGTMARKAGEKNCLFSSESIAPVMTGDAMTHYKKADIPMGEFWYNSPSHDKPTDILDAISAAHIYGKDIIQAEAFTIIRMDWNENPADLKALGDRNFALGVNRFVFHVFAHNPWTDRRPGMTLNTVGLYFQRDQTWWDASKAWMDYISRCQALLQQGKPIVDIAVFTGEEIPRRALTPDRIIDILPGLYSKVMIGYEKTRMENEGLPMIEKPYSVTSSANTYDPSAWTDPLRGYKFDSFNRDALLGNVSVKKGKIINEGGMEYGILVIPGIRKGSPNAYMSEETAEKIIELVRQGATVILEEMPARDPGLQKDPGTELLSTLYSTDGLTVKNRIRYKQLGKGKIVFAPYEMEFLEELGIERDFIASENEKEVYDVAWNHRRGDDFDLYFISNQQDEKRKLSFSLRSNRKAMSVFDPLNGKVYSVPAEITGGRTIGSLELEAFGSAFIVLENRPAMEKSYEADGYPEPSSSIDLSQDWTIRFDRAYGGTSGILELPDLKDWRYFEDDSIRYYSGPAMYTKQFDFMGDPSDSLWLDIGKAYSIAEVWLNGNSCGTVWTAPWRVSISNYIKKGENILEIRVTNTWKNRIIGDNTVFSNDPLTWTTAPFRIRGQELTPSGLTGPVRITGTR